LRKLPHDHYGYYDKNDDRLFFLCLEDALFFEKEMIMNIFKIFR
jgi:hypothetical protein